MESIIALTSISAVIISIFALIASIRTNRKQIDLQKAEYFPSIALAPNLNFHFGDYDGKKRMYLTLVLSLTNTGKLPLEYSVSINTLCMERPHQDPVYFLHNNTPFVKDGQIFVGSQEPVMNIFEHDFGEDSYSKIIKNNEPRDYMMIVKGDVSLKNQIFAKKSLNMKFEASFMRIKTSEGEIIGLDNFTTNFEN